MAEPAPKDEKIAKKEEEKVEETKVLAHYNLNANGLPVEVNVRMAANEFVPIYDVTFPGIGVATKLLLLSLRSDLLNMVSIDTARIQDPIYLSELTKKVLSASAILIDKYLPGTNEQTKSLLCSYMRNMMLGLGDLEAPLSDENLEELAVNGSKEPIWVFHKKIGWCKSNIKPSSEDSIYDQAEIIGRRVGREINNLAPLMDAELADGSRVNATLYPISQGGEYYHNQKIREEPMDNACPCCKRHNKPADCWSNLAMYSERGILANIWRNSFWENIFPKRI